MSVGLYRAAHACDWSDDPFSDPRLVELYDEDNPSGADHDYFRALADERDATTIVDLGCGTGLLTVTLTGPGRRVVGIDPAETMIERARRRPGGENVTWILGDSAAMGDAQADLVIMSGNVAQHILGAAWHEALRGIHDALTPAGIVAFESRNPSARAWEDWTEARTRGTRSPSRLG